MPILNWLTREEDIRTASSVPYRMLIEDPTVSTGDPDAENALIHSDNLN
jgi:adenine-specific DNA-methyltransferase